MKSKQMNLKPELLGKCGFYCGTCPTYINGNCNGCIEEHMEGDCFTRDCVIEKGLDACGQCEKFPCDTIITKPHTTVLDKKTIVIHTTCYVARNFCNIVGCLNI